MEYRSRQNVEIYGVKSTFRLSC